MRNLYLNPKERAGHARLVLAVGADQRRERLLTLAKDTIVGEFEDAPAGL